MIDLQKSWSYHADNFEFLAQLPDECIDAHVTDEPYGINFMGKGWDKSVPSSELWQEVYRVLKPGAFNMVLCSARQDVLARTIINLEDAGFKVAFSSIYWAYAEGMPKAKNIAKQIHKDVTGKKVPFKEHPGRKNRSYQTTNNIFSQDRKNDRIYVQKRPATKGSPFPGDKLKGTSLKPAPPILYCDEAVPAIGAFAGFSPKPAVEVCIVTMKPLSEDSYTNQFRKNHHGVTWLGHGRIPDEHGIMSGAGGRGNHKMSFGGEECGGWQKGDFEVDQDDWFPANLLISDDCIGRYSPYFSLDAWFRKRLSRLPPEQLESFPFLFVPKPTKKEKNKHLKNTDLPERAIGEHCLANHNGKPRDDPKTKNFHPTVKPLALMQYLIELASDPDEIVLDVFNGSGTTTVAAKLSGRIGIGCEYIEDYNNIALARLTKTKTRTKLDKWVF